MSLAAEREECLNNFQRGPGDLRELCSTQFLRRAHTFPLDQEAVEKEMMLTSKALYGILLALPMAYSWFGCPHSTYSNRLVVFESMPW